MLADWAIKGILLIGVKKMPLRYGDKTSRP